MAPTKAKSIQDDTPAHVRPYLFWMILYGPTKRRRKGKENEDQLPPPRSPSPQKVFHLRDHFLQPMMMKLPTRPFLPIPHPSPRPRRQVLIDVCPDQCKIPGTE